MFDPSRLIPPLLLLSSLVALPSAAEGTSPVRDPKQSLERTSFQTGDPYDPRVDLKSDVAMVYGINGNFAERMKTWRDQGYIVHLMTGVAWGEYQDYFSGKWDGKNHDDESQTDRNGNVIGHGPTVPYVSPSETYGKYLSGGVKRAIDAGAEAIYLEEPEFWVRGGYEENFKRQWKAYYGDDWIPPHSSPDGQYRASKLKYFLYRRALQQVFDFTQKYGKQIGRNIRCYVPTHSMLNYSQWRIVSPEQSLVGLNGCDGYIGQVWTGTARTPNRYAGVQKERTFETAFFEYGVLHNLVRTTGRRMYYLNDPVEDNPDHTWEDYRRNWECTLVASLLWPDVWYYEVAPWPQRPFLFKYPSEDAARRSSEGKGERVGISPAYATELLTVFNALNDMNQKNVAWESGTSGIGVLVSDTMMFQRGDPTPSDPDLGSFYGLAMPLLKRGIPVHPVQMENLALKDYLKPYKVLFLTYEGMKPPSAALHEQMAAWVKSGGVLVFVDDDADPYNAVHEWWNSNGLSYAVPRLHLFEKLGLTAGTQEGTHKVGKGAVIYRHVSPASLTQSETGAETTVSLAQTASEKAGLPWKVTNSLLLRRGPYVIASGIDETPMNATKTLTGRFIDLFDPKLSPVATVTLNPGTRHLLMDLDKMPHSRPTVIASASKVLEVTTAKGHLRFHSEGPDGTVAATRIALPAPPTSVKIGENEIGEKPIWDETTKTALLEFPNSAAGQWVEVAF